MSQRILIKYASFQKDMRDNYWIGQNEIWTSLSYWRYLVIFGRRDWKFVLYRWIKFILPTRFKSGFAKRFIHKGIVFRQFNNVNFGG